MRLGLAACSALLLISNASFADDRQACVAAHEKAQQQKNAGRLVEAREALTSCGGIECPELIKQDCTQWMTEVLQKLPTIIPAVRDTDGADLVAVRVSVDGKVVAELLDGKPIPVDPGIHYFHLTAEGKAPFDQQVVVRQGEKDRLLPITMTIPLMVSRSLPPEKQPRGLSVLGLVVGGAGVVAGGIGLGLGLSADHDARGLRDSCAPNCTDGQVDDVRSSQTVARVIGIGGGVLFVAGAVITILHYTTGEKAAVNDSIRPTSNGAVVSF